MTRTESAFLSLKQMFISIRIKMKKIVFAFLVGLVTIPAFSQSDSTKADTSYWKKGGSYNLAFTRINLQNWAGGGQSSVSFSTLLKLHADYNKKKVSWSNHLDVGYGIARVGSKKALFKKSDDQIILTSKLTYGLKKMVRATGLLDFRSQLANGFKYTADTTEESGERSTLISRFLAPGYLLTSIGAEYKSKVFYGVLSPLTGKMTFVLDDGLAAVGSFGVEPGKNIRSQLGSMVKLGYKKEVMKNVELNTNLVLFSGYDSFGDIDVNWDLTLQFKVNDYLTTTFSTLIIYDDDIDVTRNDGTVGPGTQYKDVLNVGFLYKF